MIPAEGRQMVRLASGQYVPAASSASRPYAKKALVVVHYWEDDLAEAEQLLGLIADLERIKNKEADLFVFRRHDAPNIDPTLMQKLRSKFDVVWDERCRRMDAKGYPFGCNGMFYDLVMRLSQEHKWRDDYYCFVNLEPDCVPLCPGWITKLTDAFKQAELSGKSAIGHVHEIPVLHMNGVAVYATDIWSRVPGGRLSGGSPQVAYDILQAPHLMPLCEDTPLVVFDFKRPTATPKFLFGKHKAGCEAVLFHGVRDASAREAVKARFVTFSETSTARKNVFTYYTNPNEIGPSEGKAIITLWQEGWKSRGWNPIILRTTDAVRNRRYSQYLQWVEDLPYIGDKAVQRNRFLRWLALDSMGGGLLTDWDVLPGALIAQNTEMSGFTILSAGDSSELSACYAEGESLTVWIDTIQKYLAQPDDLKDGKPSVTDMTVLNQTFAGSTRTVDTCVSEYGTKGYQMAKAVHFSQASILASTERTQRKSVLMERFLRGGG
jgi:hypothetical protein